MIVEPVLGAQSSSGACIAVNPQHASCRSNFRDFTGRHQTGAGGQLPARRTRARPSRERGDLCGTGALYVLVSMQSATSYLGDQSHSRTAAVGSIVSPCQQARSGASRLTGQGHSFAGQSCPVRREFQWPVDFGVAWNARVSALKAVNHGVPMIGHNPVRPAVKAASGRLEHPRRARRCASAFGQRGSAANLGMLVVSGRPAPAAWAKRQPAIGAAMRLDPAAPWPRQRQAEPLRWLRGGGR